MAIQLLAITETWKVMPLNLYQDNALVLLFLLILCIFVSVCSLTSRSSGTREKTSRAEDVPL